MTTLSSDIKFYGPDYWFINSLFIIDKTFVINPDNLINILK